MLRKAAFVRKRRIEVVPREANLPSSGWSKDARGFFVPFSKKLSG